MNRELLQLALDALENSIDAVRDEYHQYVELYAKYPTRKQHIEFLGEFLVKHEEAITALQTELAKPDQKPLADEEILKLADYYTTYQIESPSNAGMIEFARAIEAAHGIKENLCPRS